MTRFRQQFLRELGEAIVSRTKKQDEHKMQECHCNHTCRADRDEDATTRGMRIMSNMFSAYQRMALRTAVYPNVGDNLTYAVLSLAGEAGEFAGKASKIHRDDNGQLTPERREAMLKELGDILWHVAIAAHELGVPLGELALANLENLRGREVRGTIHGDGDNR